MSNIAARVPPENLFVYLMMSRKLKAEELKNPAVTLARLNSRPGIEQMDERFFRAVIKATNECTDWREKGQITSKGLIFQCDLCISLAMLMGFLDTKLFQN